MIYQSRDLIFHSHYATMDVNVSEIVQVSSVIYDKSFQHVIKPGWRRKYSLRKKFVSFSDLHCENVRIISVWKHQQQRKVRMEVASNVLHEHHAVQFLF